MKILFYTSSLSSGGAERVISVLSNEFIKENKVTILINNTKNIAYTLDKRIQTIPIDKKIVKNNLFRNVNRIIESKKIIKKENPDVIISFLPMPSFRILILKSLKLLKIPVIISVRNDPKEECRNVISKMLMKSLYPKTDGCVFQTLEQKNFFNNSIKEKSTIIYNPIKKEFTDNRNDITKEKTIITVGRLVEQKNQKILISAFSKIAHKYPDYNLKIFGDGPLRNELQNYIKELNLNNRVFLCGTTKNIQEELLKSEIFILTSKYEGMPNALIEAMACGLPCISTECPCGGPKELINNKKNGILIEVDNEIQLIKEIENLLNNKKFSKKIGNNARKVKEKLLPNKISEEWFEYINKVIDNYKTSSRSRVKYR